MYVVGSKVVHPCYGAGKVTRIQEKTIGETTNAYYVISTMVRSMEVMVPVDRADEVGIRTIRQAQDLRSSLVSCSEAPTEGMVESDLRARQAEMKEKLKSGTYESVIQVTRVLYYLSTVRPLGTVDRQLYEQGKELLASELALALGVDLQEAMREVEEGLGRMLADD